MELRTELDRVLEAISPALWMELDRIAYEIRQGVDAQFRERLECAIRDAELAAESRTASEVSRAIQETELSVRDQVSKHLQAQFTKAFEEKERELEQLQSEWAGERARLERRILDWRTLAEGQPQLARSLSQVEIVGRFVRLAERFAPAVAVYIAGPDGLVLWKNRKPAVASDGRTSTEAFPDTISSETRDLDLYFKAIVVRGRTVAAVSATPPYREAALDLLAASMERAIELFGARLREPRSVEPAASGMAASSGPVVLPGAEG